MLLSVVVPVIIALMDNMVYKKRIRHSDVRITDLGKDSRFAGWRCAQVRVLLQSELRNFAYEEREIRRGTDAE